MLRFILRRLAELVVVFFGVTFIIYAAVFALPGAVFLTVTVVSLIMLGDALRDALDPKSR